MLDEPTSALDFENERAVQVSRDQRMMVNLNLIHLFRTICALQWWAGPASLSPRMSPMFSVVKLCLCWLEDR